MKIRHFAALIVVVMASLAVSLPPASAAELQLAQAVWERDEGFPRIPERPEEGAEQMGMVITPSITIGEAYDDNIFLTDTGRESDYITLVSPELTITRATRAMSLLLDYTFSYEYFARHSKESTAIHKAELDYSLSALRDIFHLRLYDKYGRRTIDNRRPVALDNVLVNLTDSNQFFVNPSIELPLSATFLTVLEYSYENLWYDSPEGDDTQNHRAGARLVKAFTPGTRVSLSYEYLFHRPDISEDYDRQEVSLGLESQLTPRLSLGGNVGQAFFNFKDREDSEATVWDVHANYLLTEAVSFGASYSVTFNESVDAGTYKSQDVRGTLYYNGKVQGSLSVFRYTSDFLESDRQDKASGASIGATAELLPALTGSLEGVYTRFEFRPDDEDVNRYSVRAGLGYALRRTLLTLSYTYNQNDSSVDGNDYRNNVIQLTLKLSV